MKLKKTALAVFLELEGMSFLTESIHEVFSMYVHTHMHTCVHIPCITHHTTYPTTHTHTHTLTSIPYTHTTYIQYIHTLKSRTVNIPNTDHQDGMLKFSRVEGQIKNTM